MMRDSQTRFAELVAFPAISTAANLGLIDHVEAFVAGHGVEFRRFPTAGGDKANLAVCIGPDVPGGMAFSQHTDVVPVEGLAWLATHGRCAPSTGGRSPVAQPT